MANEHFERRIWISFGIISASIVIAGVVLYLFSGDLAANASAIITARSVVNNQNSAVANLAALKEQAARATQYQMAMNQLIPDQYGLVTFGQWFAAQGSKYGVGANANFQGTANAAQGATPGGAAFSFTASGSIGGISSFMDLVSTQTSGFLVTFNSFSIGSDGDHYSVTGQGEVISK